MSFKKTVNVLAEGGGMPVSCRICGGGLKPALSPKALGGKVPDDIILAAYSAGAKHFCLCTDSEIYSSVAGINFLLVADLVGDLPFLVEDIADGNPRAVMINGGSAIVNTGLHYDAIFSLGAELRCGVMHCGRLFAADKTDGYMLRWSGCGGVADWAEKLDGSGSLKLDPDRGEILDVIEFGEKLVAVREFGLTVLSMYGSPENFSAEITNTDADGVFKGTARVAGGKLIFCTSSGLHSFDGSRVTALNHAYAGDISDFAHSAVLDGKYFVSCKSQSLKGRAVLCYDTDENDSYLINLSADGLCPSEKIYAYNSSGAFRLEEGGEYVYTSGLINFGSGGRKTVTSVFIDGEADIEISNGRITRKYSGAKGLIRPALRGESFTFKFTGNKPVHGVTATAEECDVI